MRYGAVAKKRLRRLFKKRIEIVAKLKQFRRTSAVESTAEILPRTFWYDTSCSSHYLQLNEILK